jgi:hypothetical protein
MAIVVMIVGLIMVALLISGSATNTDPEKSEAQEAEDIKQSVEHQGWQLMDWQM